MHRAMVRGTALTQALAFSLRRQSAQAAARRVGCLGKLSMGHREAHGACARGSRLAIATALSVCPCARVHARACVRVRAACAIRAVRLCSRCSPPGTTNFICQSTEACKAVWDQSLRSTEGTWPCRTLCGRASDRGDWELGAHAHVAIAGAHGAWTLTRGHARGLRPLQVSGAIADAPRVVARDTTDAQGRHCSIILLPSSDPLP